MQGTSHLIYHLELCDIFGDERRQSHGPQNFVDDACICIGNANAALEEQFASLKQLPDRAKLRYNVDSLDVRWLSNIWCYWESPLVYKGGHQIL